MLADLHPVATFEMPDAPIPKDWVKCRFASLQFSLPPELANNLEIKNHGKGLIFKDSSRTVSFIVPATTESRGSLDLEKDPLLSQLRVIDPEINKMPHITLTRLQLALLPVSHDDFRWSMTPQEVQRHMLRMVVVATIRPVNKSGKAECLVYNNHNNIEGILHDPGLKTMLFEWSVRDGRYEGMISFRDDADQSNSDLSWVRGICRSLEFLPDGLLESLPQEEDKLRELFHREELKTE